MRSQHPAVTVEDLASPSVEGYKLAAASTSAWTCNKLEVPNQCHAEYWKRNCVNRSNDASGEQRRLKLKCKTQVWKKTDASKSQNVKSSTSGITQCFPTTCWLDNLGFERWYINIFLPLLNVKINVAKYDHTPGASALSSQTPVVSKKTTQEIKENLLTKVSQLLRSQLWVNHLLRCLLQA